MNAVLKDIEYRTAYDGCPLCSGVGEIVRTEEGWSRGKMLCDLVWMKCGACGHVHTAHFFNDLGLKELFTVVMEDGVFGGKIDEQRFIWGRIIDRLIPYVNRVGKWIDVGVGNGGFLFTASEYGFDAIGIDTRGYVLDPLREFGYCVENADATTYDYDGAVAVILADVLEHIPYPKELLKRIRSKLRGVLFVSCPNMDCISWRYNDTKGGSVYWKEPEHYHNFTRARLQALLVECGFTPVHYGVSARYQACMEIVAI